MRFAMGVTPYWSVFAALLLAAATLLKLRNDRKGIDPKAAREDEWTMMGKQSPISGNRQSRTLLVAPEDALS